MSFLSVSSSQGFIAVFTPITALRSLVGLEAHPAPFEMSGPPVHSGTPLLPSIPGFAYVLVARAPNPLGVLHPSPLCLSTHLDGLASAPSAPLAGLTVPWLPRV